MAGVPRFRVLAVLSAVLALVLAACGSGGASAPAPGLQKIRIALDWTPNTNHTGLFVAQQEGWFRAAGLDVEILPYTDTAPETLVSSGAADFGISFQDAFTFAKATGAEITSVMAIVQHWDTQIAVRADRADITSPKDLDGKTYGGFGGPGEQAKMRAVITAAGGKGDFKTVVLGTSAYEALYAGQVDFTEPFITVEGVEAKLRGEPLKTFSYTDYGFPDAYNVILIGNSPWLTAHHDLAKAFVGAVQRGYELAASDPAQAGKLLMAANPGTFTEPAIVTQGLDLLSAHYLRDAAGKVGPQTLATWSGYSGWVFDSGVLTGQDGKPLTARPDFATWFTNDYLGS
ncbi:ABC transporter substrate-binding protein [Pseudonocardia sp. GCM10023141]|uniref:ABC transporter substrate-binding protein n=1 Tax=Pseudonocardia sp. GCM10023141 TaxID=3252653 RepID=UPI00361DF14C